MDDVNIYGSVKKCPKCEYRLMDSGGSHGRGLCLYDSSRNVLKVICPNCRFIWHERCADGTDPKPEFEWVEYTRKPIFQKNDGTFNNLTELLEAFSARITDEFGAVQEKLKNIFKKDD